ncbi:MAG: DUF721 domain-containing protein [Oligoflexia bacterium]|nr:DUF721 domain-containing protein [Oligoflexia bacterium]
MEKHKKTQEPERIGGWISDFLDQLMPAHLREEAKVFRAWVKAVGPEITKNTKPLNFKRGTLYVATRHSTWSLELSSKRARIIEKLNSEIGSPLVNEIHFKVGTI